jgi:predicted GNAT superfamily acetyltransferase
MTKLGTSRFLGLDRPSRSIAMRMLYLVESHGKLLLVRRMILHEHARGRGQIHTFDGQCEPELAIFKAYFQRSR